MKSTFLAVSVTPNAGKSAVLLRDVNGGEGNNDFRAGSRTGDLLIDIFGEQTLFVPGKTYLFAVSEFTEETGQDTQAEPATSTAENEPVTIEFEGSVQITTVGKSVMVAVKPLESEPVTDTQVNGVASDAIGTTDANAGESADNADKSTATDVSDSTGETVAANSIPVSGETATNTATDTQDQPGASTGDNKEAVSEDNTGVDTKA